MDVKGVDRCKWMLSVCFLDSMDSIRDSMYVPVFDSTPVSMSVCSLDSRLYIP